MRRSPPFDPSLIPLATPSVRPIGKTYVTLLIGGYTGASMVVATVVDPNGFPPNICVAIVGAPADCGDSIQPNDVGLPVARQDLVRPGIGCGTGRTCG